MPASFGIDGNGSSSPISGGGVKEESGEGDGGGVVKANKGMILRKSVDYIRSDFICRARPNI